MSGGKISGKEELKRNLRHNFTDYRESHPYHYERSTQTIELTNLNRDELKWKRRKVIENFENLLKLQTLMFLKERTNQQNVVSGIRLAFFVVFEIIENQVKEEEEYTLTGWWTWENIKEILFKNICKDNQDIERMLDYALALYMQSKS